MTYPSALGECGQAVVAAQAAASAGTKVYTIGYGAETSGGCATDAKYSASVTNGDGVTWATGDQPCQALGAMASSRIEFLLRRRLRLPGRHGADPTRPSPN